MNSSFTIAVIGAGNMGFNLCKAIDQSNYRISEVYNRDLKKAQEACSLTKNGRPTDSLDFSNSKSQLFIVAVSDDAIEAVAKEIILPDNAVLAHTAGSVPLSMLSSANTENIGVFYPLQSLSRTKLISFREVPLLVESGTEFTRETLLLVANAISKSVYAVNSDQRLRIHLAATILNNFTNHLLRHAFEQLKMADQDPEILYPLLKNTVDKAINPGPNKSQTGPAIRGDAGTIKKHLDLLRDDNSTTELYKLFTNQISATYSGD